MPGTIVSLLFAWRIWLGTYSSKVWNMILACLMWLVWKEHNARTFEDIEKPIDMLKNLLARTLFEWSRIWGLTHCSSLFDILISISLSLWFVCICFKGSEFTIVNTLFLFINKTLIIYKKKKKLVIYDNWIEFSLEFGKIMWSCYYDQCRLVWI